MQKTRKLPEREGALSLACRRALVMWWLFLATKSSSVLGLGSQQLMNNPSPGSKAKQHQVQRVQHCSSPHPHLAGSWQGLRSPPILYKYLQQLAKMTQKEMLFHKGPMPSLLFQLTVSIFITILQHFGGLGRPGFLYQPHMSKSLPSQPPSQ